MVEVGEEKERWWRRRRKDGGERKVGEVGDWWMGGINDIYTWLLCTQIPADLAVLQRDFLRQFSLHIPPVHPQTQLSYHHH